MHLHLELPAYTFSFVLLFAFPQSFKFTINNILLFLPFCTMVELLERLLSLQM